MAETKEHILGSGHLHVKIISEEALKAAAADWAKFVNDFIKEQKLLGRVKGGASLDYTTEKTEDQDDLGYVVLEIVKKEKVELKSGIMTWDGDSLKTLCSTARVTKNEETGVVTVKIGGLGNQNNDRYVICFEHYSHLFRVVIIGKNNDGFSISFEQDKATVIDAVFRAEAMDDDGTLVIIQDFRKATDEAKAELLQSISSSTSEQTPSENSANKVESTSTVSDKSEF
ncbi:MAG: hypothetical protein K2H23_03870 [Oscillospiraceae bacterium]|nr:hypothetical protein [Oscillospiraceae bacterium]